MFIILIFFLIFFYVIWRSKRDLYLEEEKENLKSRIENLESDIVDLNEQLDLNE